MVELVVVGLRASLRSFKHGTQIQHRHHAAQNFRFEDTQDHHLDYCSHPRNLWFSLLSALRHAMLAIQLFLDSLYWWNRKLHRPNHHCQRNLCIFCYLMCRGLDTWTSPNLPRVEPADEPQDKSLSCGNSRSGGHVSFPSSLSNLPN